VHYTVVVDGEVSDELVTTSGERTYIVVEDLEPGEHTVEVDRQGEASFGATLLWAVEPIDGNLLDPPKAPERRIEILGDSITCGYGNEGESTSCSFSAETENHYLSYGAILARGFDAELSTVAWSGKGVVVNYGGDMGTTLPEMLERAVPQSSTSVWDYSLVAPPDLVLINLGTNDFSTDNDPELAEFVSVYLDMLNGIRARYPDAFIVCTVGPLLNGRDRTMALMGISEAVASTNDAGDDAVVAVEIGSSNPSPGCDWHPSLATHEAMAEELSAPIAEYLDW
jgi:lysophospholipase L1-like esterase